MPPRNLPFPPMEAELIEELPEPDGWQYEPKWDGFRGVLENLDGELHLWSRNARPLLRYFPELRDLVEQRRNELEERGASFRLSPITGDRDQAVNWLQRLEAAGLDGVVAKRLGLP